jgi:GNAT superfamily N-acetyltransferase
MSVKTPSGDQSHRVREARAADLKHLAAIEEAGGPLFEEVFGDTLPASGGDPLLSPAPRGADRDDTPGFLLVVGPVGEPVGFAHVEVVEGFAHLAQLSVHPDAMRRGLGSALVRAAMREAWALGYDRLSLTTYRDLPWNGPFYARLGFVEATHPEPFELRFRDHERRIGLDRHGPRVVMEVALRPRRPGRDVTGG